MKKIYLLSFLSAIFCLGQAQGQIADRPASFGLKVGLNLADFNDPDGILSNQDKGMLVAYHTGAFATFLLSDKFSVQPEVFLSVQGAKYKDPLLIDPDTGQPVGAEVESAKDEHTYLSIPVLLQFSPSPGFRIEAGPQLGILLRAEATAENNGQSASQDQKDYYKSMDFGAGIGLGYRHSSGFDLYGRYTRGFTNIFEEEAIGNSSASLTTSVISIGVGYIF